jgi:hypothetical protein
VTQEYRNAEFIVCDNASADDTEAVVRSFSDPRVRLINPGKRVSMRENWEFALDHVAGDYVTFIGDDDALMPRALETLSSLLASRNVDAIKWQAPTYYWPVAGSSQAGHLVLKFGNRIAPVKSSAALNALRWGYLYYTYLPMIYHGALSRRLIGDVKARSGQFFCSEIPDIYSGIAAALATKEYHYLQLPLTISGASRHSTGTTVKRMSTVEPDTAASKFYAENKLGPHPEFLDLAGVPSSIHSYVTDALLRARDSICGGKLYVPLWYRLMLIVREISQVDPAVLQTPSHPLRTYSAKRNMEWLYSFYVRRFAKRGQNAAPGANPSVLSIDAGLFGTEEVFGASNFLDELVRCISILPADVQVTTSSLLFGRLLAKLARHDAFQLFKSETFS